MRGDKPNCPSFLAGTFLSLAIARNRQKLPLYRRLVYYQSGPITKFFLIVSQAAGLQVRFLSFFFFFQLWAALLVRLIFFSRGMDMNLQTRIQV